MGKAGGERESPPTGAKPGKRRGPSGILLEPSFQSHSIFLEQETTCTEAFAEDAVRFRVAGGAGNPLRANSVLSCREPTLWQDLNQSGVEVENEQCHGRIVGAFPGI